MERFLFNNLDAATEGSGGEPDDTAPMPVCLKKFFAETSEPMRGETCTFLSSCGYRAQRDMLGIELETGKCAQERHQAVASALLKLPTVRGTE